MAKVSIIITTKNRKKDLLACVHSLLASSFLDFEIIIVDDCSGDGTEKLTKTDFNFSNIEIYHSNKPLYMAQARNFGAQKANTDYLLFIDDDNVADKEMVKNLIYCADKYSDYGIIGPRMFYLETKEEYLASQRINLFTGKTTGYTAAELPNEIYSSDGIPNAFLIKKQVFQKCGYFDEKLMQTFSEPDLAFRAKKAGFKCVIYKQALIYHNVTKQNDVTSRGLGGNFPIKAYCLIRNRIIFILRYGNPLQKSVFLSCFSWFYPLIYSLLVLRFMKFDLILFYWLGFKDGLNYIFSKEIKNSLQKE